MLTLTTDIVFLVDESASNQESETQEYLSSIVDDLDATLVGASIDARYGLVGYGENGKEFAHSQLIGGSTRELFSDNISDLQSAIGELADSGDSNAEDGWDAIEHAIAEYPLRDGAVPVFFVVQGDEGRVKFDDQSLTREGILQAIKSKGGIVNTLSPGALTADGVVVTGDPGEPFEDENVDWSWLPLFSHSTYSTVAGAEDIEILGVEADAADGLNDGAHNFHWVDTNTINSTPDAPTQTVVDALQVSFNGSNTGSTGLVKNGRSIAIGQSVVGGLGGQDGDTNTYRAARVDFDPVDMSGATTESFGTTLTLPPSFSFEYFGQSQTQIYVNRHGTISFGSSLNDDENVDLNDSLANRPIQPMIASLWDDLSGGSLLIESGDFDGDLSTDLAIQWTNMEYADSPNTDDKLTFQTVLYGTNEIRINYIDIESDFENDQGNSKAYRSTGGVNATVGAWSGSVASLTVPAGDYVPGLHSLFPDTAGEATSSYARLAWDTGGAAWDVGVVARHNATSPEANALRDAISFSLVEQIRDACRSIDQHHQGELILALNLGGTVDVDAGAAGIFRADDGDFTVDGGHSVVDTNTTTSSIDVGSTNAIPTGNASALEDVFQTARADGPSGSDFNDDIVLEIDKIDVPDGSGGFLPLEDGSYIVELFFADILTQYDTLPFDVEIEGVTLLNEYWIRDDHAKIVAGSTENSSEELGYSTTNQAAGTVKRFEVLVQGGDGLQIVLHNDSGGNDPQISGLRILRSPAPGLQGDYNRDDIVNAADYTVWRNNLGTVVENPFDGADGNGDGIVNQEDYQVWVSNYGAIRTCHLVSVDLPGDYNDDDVVNAADYTVWRNNLGSTTLLPNDTTPGTVTQEDYDVWRNNYGATLTPPAIASVPGDYNRDGSVNDVDYNVWLTNLGSEADLYADGNDNGIIDIGDLAVWQEYRGVTTVDNFDGDYNNNGVVDQADYELWSATYGSTTQLAADGNDNGMVDVADYTIWRDNLGTTNAAVLPMFLSGGGGMPLEVPDAAPQVLEVALNGSNSVHPQFNFSTVDGSGEQLRSVPVGGIDTLSVQFSEEVFVLNSDLGLVNLTTGTPVVVLDYFYDLSAQTAIWQFDGQLAPGQYAATLDDSIIDLDWESLDGEYSNPWGLADPAGTPSTFPSGDGEAGGEFRFRFTVLDGDYNGDNATNAADYSVWANNNGLTGETSTRQGDGDGSGIVDSADYSVWASQYGYNFTNWPSVVPGAILVSTLADEDDGDHSLGDLSLREALDIAASQSGTDRIEFRHDLSGGTINLGLGELLVDSDVLIAGLGSENLAISGGEASRIFNISSGVSASISDLGLVDGYAGSGNGGAIYSEGELALESVVVADNVASSGGGIYQSGGTLTLDQSSILDNEATFAGGGVTASSASTFVVANSTVARNESIYVGGIWGNNSPAEIVNSTISTNTANSGYGGGAYFYSTSSVAVNVTNSTITKNSAGSGTGGGLYSVNTTADVSLFNTIVADNSSNSGVTDAYGPFNASSASNLVGVVDGSTGLTDPSNLTGTATAPLDAGLLPLGDYGDATQTHQLLTNSIAIDAGDASLALDDSGVPLTTDQRGRARSTGPVDIGAVEHEILGDYNGNGTVDLADYTVWRDRLGSTTALVADGDGNGIVDANDYQVWKDHYGSSTGPDLSAAYGIYVVSTTDDIDDGDYSYGELSLREAIDLAASHASADVIVFHNDLSGSTITLGSELLIDSDVDIVGPGADQLTLSGGGSVRAFNIVSAATASISGLTISDGYSTSSDGGAIGTAGYLTLKSVEIKDSYSIFGGAIYAAGGTLTIENSTLADNYAQYLGGAVYAYNTVINIENSTVSNNGTQYGGGGIYTSNGQLTLSHSTVTQNSTNSGSGGGLYVGSAQVSLDHSIVAGNLMGSSASDIGGTVVASSAYNLIGTGGSGGLPNGSNNNQVGVANAGLTALGDYGGPTRTHALLDGSSAIDAGDPSFSGSPTSDQRGSGRIEDGDDDLIDRLDIGAFELAADEYFGTL